MPYKDLERRRESGRERSRRWYHKHKNLTDHAIYMRRWRAENPERAKAPHRDRRAQVLKAYGGECVCCGEGQQEFLVIDHTNNDGAEHRRTLGGTVAVYCWLVANDYPQGIVQILCHNCNAAKAYYGKCPHEV